VTPRAPRASRGAADPTPEQVAAHERPVRLVEIPPDVTPVACRYCPALVYWVGREPLAVSDRIVTRAGVRETHARRPAGPTPGLGYSHFVDCSGRERARREKHGGAL
jgi:hypothetical protein